MNWPATIGLVCGVASIAVAVVTAHRARRADQRLAEQMERLGLHYDKGGHIVDAHGELWA